MLPEHLTGFVAHDGIRPVLTVDFNAQKDGGRMWARRANWVLTPGQPVILRESDGNGAGIDLECDGYVVKVAPRNSKGEPCPEYVVVQIADEPQWRDGPDGS